MALRINDTVPNFIAYTTDGLIQFHDWVGDSWAVLFSHPRSFTPVCTTEFSVVAQLAPEWAKRNTKVIGLSVDSAEDHLRWKGDIETFGGAKVGFPIIADLDLGVAKAFSMLPSEAFHSEDSEGRLDLATVRAAYIIGPDKKLKLSMVYPMSVGRNFAEVLRALDALQTVEGEAIATPADWRVGEDVIVALSLNDEEAKARYGALDVRLPYVRMARPPA